MNAWRRNVDVAVVRRASSMLGYKFIPLSKKLRLIPETEGKRNWFRSPGSDWGGGGDGRADGEDPRCVWHLHTYLLRRKYAVDQHFITFMSLASLQ